MTKKALVVVDLQEDFLEPTGSLKIKRSKEIISHIIDILHGKTFDLYIATLDWHPANHTSFASQHGVEPFTELEFHHPETGEAKKQFVWPDHCIQNTHGSRLAPSFAEAFDKLPTNEKAIIKKGYLQDREYYSCFQDTWGIHHTEIEGLLKDNQIKEVTFVGLAYDYCVLNSAIDCAHRKFKTFVVKSLCRSVSEENDERTTTMYKNNGVTVVDSILEVL